MNLDVGDCGLSSPT